MQASTLLRKSKGNILVLTLNRPDKLNALNSALLSELAAAIVSSEADDSIRVVVLTGAGNRAFVAGADISEFSSFSVAEGKNLAQTNQAKVFDAIQNARKPWIAAINGFALGGGFELALACHIRLASEQAKLGLPELSLGLIPGYGGTQRLLQLAGKGRALEMMLCGTQVSASEAFAAGIVSRVCAPDALMQAAFDLADRAAERAPLALASAIRAVNSAYSANSSGYETEINEFAALFGTADFREGTEAFLQKRKAEFKGM